jgi:hypothetical protein
VELSAIAPPKTLDELEAMDDRYVLRRELKPTLKAQDVKIVSAILIGQGLARIPFHLGETKTNVAAIAGAGLALGGKLFATLLWGGTR